MMASRQERFEADVQTVKVFFDGPNAGPFKEFSYESLTLSFSFQAPDKETVQCSFIFTEDYPEGTAVCCGDGNPQKIIGRLPAAFHNFVEELCTKHGQPVPATGLSPGPASPAALQTQVSEVSTVSYASDMGYEDDDDYDSLMGDDMVEDTLHPLLEADMQRLQADYGEDSISCRVFGEGFEFIDVELQLQPRTFLQESTADAWQVSLAHPIVVRLHVCRNQYLNYLAPSVEVYQPDDKRPGGVLVQLRKITEEFLADRWKEFSNESVERIIQEAEERKAAAPVKEGGTGASKAGSSQPGFVKRGVDAVKRLLHGPEVSEANIAKLCGVGFSPERARKALQLSDNSPDSAASLLLDSKRFAELTRDMDEVPSASCEAEAEDEEDEDFLVQAASSKEAKVIPDVERGVLCQVMKYLHNRLPSLNEFCVVCDNSHVFQSATMLKPTVCARELCVFAFQTLGVMADAAQEIATGPEVVDLLVNMCNAACRSHRRGDIFDPYPTVVDPCRGNELAFNPNKKNFDRVVAAMEGLLNIEDVIAGGSTDKIKGALSKRDPLSYPLLQWIISSNRSHIVKLPKSRSLSFMKTPHQFLLISDSPVKERSFCLAKKKHGSTFAFHGSSIENWHSIMRNGLINASGTKYQQHGAAYGKGIYLSPELSTSMGYCGGGSAHRSAHPRRSSERFLNKNVVCVALCEVITSPDLRKSGSIWVCPKAEHVCTRFFFVYDASSLQSAGMNVEQVAKKAEIAKCIGTARSA